MAYLVMEKRDYNRPTLTYPVKIIDDFAWARTHAEYLIAEGLQINTHGIYCYAIVDADTGREVMLIQNFRGRETQWNDGIVSTFLPKEADDPIPPIEILVERDQEEQDEKAHIAGA